MARRTLVNRDYTFNPVTGTIVIPEPIQRERLMLITNVTRNKVIYNFSDQNLGALSYSISDHPTSPDTTVVLEYNTADMSSTDDLSIIYDDAVERFLPHETMIDAVGKMRVSTPQSLIDTDFEYSVQNSKWETLTLQNNYPSFFSRGTGGNSFDLLSVTSNGASPRSTITVTTNSLAPHGLNSGDIVSVQETLNALADGTSVIQVTNANVFTYVAKGIIPAGELLDGTLTTIYGGGIFDNAHIPGGIPGQFNAFAAVSDEASAASGGSTITIQTQRPHGLYAGVTVLFAGSSATSIDGNFLVTKVPTATTLQFKTPNLVLNPINTDQLGFYVRPEGYVDHRPFDGGVILSTANNVCGTQTIRQTRRYFRYQSGKSIQFSTGTKFTPTFDITDIYATSTAAGSNYINITTLQDHNLQPGAEVLLEGIETIGYNPYNGVHVVYEVINNTQLRLQTVFTQTISGLDQYPGGVNAFLTAYRWKGSATRAGLYDDQNGFYFEYDGTKLYAVKRFSNKELFGKLTCTQYSNLITGQGTRFRKQLVVGQYIVIRGQSYRVIGIDSDTQMYVSPAYRGSSNTSARYMITQVEKIPLDEWNIDRFDGTGPSGFKLDLSKMQMTYIDYSWYGAGYIRFGLRTTEGDIAWGHKISNNNINTAAYMRSGNLPARYETINEPLESTRLIAGGDGVSGSTLFPQQTLLYVENVDRWPAQGHLRISDNTNFEICEYTQIGAYNSTLRAYPITVIRRAPQTLVYGGQSYVLSGTSSLVNFVPDLSIPGGSGNAQVSVQTISQNCAPVMSHWGSSVIMDGGFNDDSFYLFTAGMQRYLQVGGSGTVSATVTNRSRAANIVTLTTSTNHGLQVGSSATISGILQLSTITGRQITSGVATIFMASDHDAVVGNQVTVTGLDSRFNGTYTVASVPNNNTLTYSRVGQPNVSFASASGTATVSTSYNGVFTLTAASGNTLTYSNTGPDEPQTSVIPNGTVQQSLGSTPIPRPLISLRIAPSVDNGIARNFGVRELANRMQLKLDSIGVLASGQFLIEGILNPASMNGPTLPTAWETVRVGAGSLAQVIFHDNTGTQGATVTSPTNTIGGGDRVFAFYTEAPTGGTFSVTNFSATKIRDLGNSILNGNGSQTNPSFPNGPDVLTIVATNIGTAAANISARVTWTEAQA
jgi:hypothetical protein